jgi:hypothetical protein
VRVVITGSRHFADPLTATAAIVRRIEKLPADAILYHGDAAGADRIAGKAADNRGIPVVAMPAQWGVHVPGCRCEGRDWCLEAGKQRNLKMLDLQPDLVIAFWNGKSTGTAHTMTNARTRGIELEVITLR